MEQIMSIKEAERLGIMKELERKNLTYQEASEILELSRRQTIRLMKRYRSEGAEGLVSRKRGKSSPRKLKEKTRAKALNLIRIRYTDFGPTLVSEKLKENHKVEISRETLRKWMSEEGLWKGKKRKERKVHPRRTRRSRIGELIQVDGSYHKWFEDRGEKCCLILFVDDATSQIMLGRFCKAETTKDYMEALKSYIGKYGRPLALYSDKHSVFRVNRKEVEKGHKETQMGRALKSLKIKLICANSPQAKGRVERANGTLQDRLVKEMRLRELKSKEEGNKYLKEFIKSYNNKFGKDPLSKENAHQKKEGKVEEILALHETRKLTKNLSFQYENKYYQVSSKTPNRLMYKPINIIEIEGKPIIVKHQGEELKYSIWSEQKDNRPQEQGAKELEGSWKIQPERKPKKKHPWR